MPKQGNTNGAVGVVAQVAAVLSIAAGIIHISAAADHTAVQELLAGFVAVATLQILFGAALVLGRPSKLILGAGLLLMLGSIAAWVVSRTSGLPFLEDGHAEPVGFKDGVTVLFEAASVPALFLLMSGDLARVSLPPRLGNRMLSAAATGSFVLLVPALLFGGGEQHTHEQAVAMGIHEADGTHSTRTVAHADSRSPHARGENANHRKGEKHARGDGDKKHKGGHATDSTTTFASTNHGHDDSAAGPRHSDANGKTHDDARDHDAEHDRKRGRDKGHGKHRDDNHGKGDHEGDGEGQPANPVQQLVEDVVAIVQPPSDPR